MPATLEQAIKFIRVAREILKTPGKFYGKDHTAESLAAKAALAKVRKNLEDLKGKSNPPPATYPQLEQEFITLSKLGEASENSNDKSLALTLTAQLDHLGNCIAAEAGNSVDVNASLNTLKASVEAIYTGDLDAARVKNTDLSGNNVPHDVLYGGPFKFDGGVEALISSAEAAVTVAQPDPKRETSFTNAIKILTGVQKEYSEGNALYSVYQTYKAKMDQAEVHRRELFLLSTGTTIFSESFTTAMTNARSTAEGASTGVHNFQGAVDRLDKEIKLFRTHKQTALDAQAKKLLEAQYQPVYDDKVKRIEKALLELKARPGTSVWVKKLEKSLEDGATSLGNFPGDYVKAKAALAGLTKTRKDGLAAAENFNAIVGDEPYRTKLAEAENQLKKCEDLVGRSQYEQLAKSRKEIDASVMALSNDPSVLRGQMGILTTIVSELVTLANSQQQAQSSCVISKNTASDEMTEFQSQYLINNYKVLPKFRQAESEFAVDNYAEAKRLYDEVSAELTVIKDLPQNKDAYLTWQQNLIDLKVSGGPLALLTEALNSNCKSVKKYDTLAMETDALIKNWQLSRDYVAANAIAERAKAAALDIGLELDRFHDRDTERLRLSNLTDAKINAATLKIGELGAAPWNGDVEPFKILLDELKEEWRQDRLTKTFDTDAEMLARYNVFAGKVDEKIVDKIQKMLAAFNKDANLTSNPTSGVSWTQEDQDALAALDTSKKDAKSKEITEEFKKKFSEISATITSMKKDALTYDSLESLGKQLPPINHPVISNATTKLDGISSNVARNISADPFADFTTIRGDVTNLETDLADVLEELGKQRGLRSTYANTEIDNCLALLTPLMKDNWKLAPYFIPFTSRIDDLKAMANSNIWTTVDQCVAVATAWKTDLPTIVRQSDFTTIDSVLRDIENKLENEDLSTHSPKRLEVFKLRFETIKVDLYENGPDPAKPAAIAVTDFNGEIGDAISAAGDVKQTKLDITKLAEECTALLVGMSGFPKLQKSFTGMIKSESPPAEGGEQAALQRLQVIKIQIDALLQPEAAEDLLKEEQKKAKQASKAEQQKKEFGSKLKVFNEKQIPVVNNLNKETGPDKVNSNLYKNIFELRDEAVDMGKKELFEAALGKLDAARTAAQRFLNNPLSIPVNARNELKKVGDDWLKTISTFVKSMNVLKAAVKTSMEAENQINVGTFNVGEVMQPLTEAARSFEANKFPDYIKAMLLANEAANVKKYRELKEDALRFVRAYQTIVTNDPVLLSAASNPFQVVVSLSSVKDALRDLDVNLRRA